MPLHLAGILGLIIIFVVGTTRSINLGALSLALTFLVGTVLVGETPREMASGFPVDLFVLLTGVTYLFGVATKNGTVERIVDRAVGLARGHRSLVPWLPWERKFPQSSPLVPQESLWSLPQQPLWY